LALRKLGRDSDAVPHARRAAELAPEDARYHGRLASVLLFGAGDAEGAREAVARALALPDPPAEAYVVRAALRGEATREALLASLEDYRRAVEVDPTESDGHRGMGYALMRLGKPAEAMQPLERALVLDPRHAFSHVWRARCLHELDRDEDALAAFDAGLATLPSDLRLLQAKAFFLVRDLHRPQDALPVLEEAARVHAGDWRVAFNLAILLLDLHRLDDAVKALLRVEEIVPDDPERPFERAEILLGHGRYEEAREGFERAIAMKPTWDAPRCGLLHLLGETGAWEEGLRQAQAAHDLFPSHPYVRFVLVDFLRATGETQEAEERARRFAAELGDDGDLRWPYAHYVLAVAGETETLAARLPPTAKLDGEGLYLLARIRAVLGDDDAVVRCLEASLAGGYRRHAGSAHAVDLCARTDPRVAALLERLVR
jgi:tetratricopeptide (TPR) repeat protein